MSLLHRDLIENALFDRRTGPSASCFVSNEHGVKLLDADSDALPAIELVINEVVLPTCSAGHCNPREFPGLIYVLGAYFVISQREQLLSRAIQYFRSVPAVLQEQMIIAIRVFFGRRVAPESLLTNPTAELVQFVMEISMQAGPLGQTALRCLAKIGDEKRG